MNFQERVRDICELFSLRNAMYMRGDMRVLFLTDAIRRLGKLLRNEESDIHELSKALASVFARTCAFADSFVNLPIADAMCEKYPKNNCAYCGKSPCACEQKRGTEIVLAPISKTQMVWTVKEWCGHLDAVYGKKNRERGINYAHSRLSEEVGEVVSAQLIEVYDQRHTLTEVRQTVSREFADVFAWIFSIAGILEIDLDSVLEDRYPKVHHRCGQRPCNCGPYYLYNTSINLRIPHAETKVGK